jgi:hypothetical protein
MIYIILSILLFSFNNILWKKNLENVPVTFLVAYRAFFTSIVALFLFFYLYDFSLYTPYLLLRITTGSILGIYNLSGIVFTSLYLIFIEEINFSQSILGVALVVLGFVYFIHFNKETLIKIT